MGKNGLTKRDVESFKCEGTTKSGTPLTQTFLWCPALKGFGVRVTRDGVRSYVVQGRVNGTGKEFRQTIGRHGVFTVDQAREVATEMLRDLRLGRDPKEKKARTKAESVTLKEVAAEYCEHKRTKHGPLTERTKADINAHVTKSFAAWADKPVKDITRDACVKRFKELSSKGLKGDRPAPAQANQAFIVLRALLNFARERYRTDSGPIIAENPVAVLKGTWNATKARTERIPNDKVGEVWNLLQERRADKDGRGEATAADIVAFLLLTGARWSEAAELKWENVDLEGKVPSWHLPKTKNHNPLTVPLSSTAKELLEGRPRVKNNPFVFAGRGGKGHIGDPRAMWEAVSKIAGLHLSAHSMRRSFTNIAIKCGIDLFKIELLTNHVPKSVTLIHYTETSDLRESCAAEVQRIADWIVKEAKIAADKASGANVVALAA